MPLMIAPLACKVDIEFAIGNNDVLDGLHQRCVLAPGLSKYVKFVEFPILHADREDPLASGI